MIIAGIKSGPLLLCVMTLGVEGPKYWATGPRRLTYEWGVKLIDYLAERPDRQGIVSFGGRHIFRALGALMTTNHDEERAGHVLRMFACGRDVEVAHYAITFQKTSLAALCSGPGPRYTENTLGIVEWLLAPAKLWADLAQQIGCIAFLDASCTRSGAAAFIAAGGTQSQLSKWIQNGAIMTTADARAIIIGSHR
jgi:hypothetical protein